MLEELSRDHQGSVIDVKFGRIACERDKALAINSMQVWRDALAGLREMWRVTKPGGRIALGFTRYSGQPKEGLKANGFTKAQMVETSKGLCVVATKDRVGRRRATQGTAA